MILALSLDAVMKQRVLGDPWANRRMKAVRRGLINVPGRVVRRARQLTVRLTANHPPIELLLHVRARLARLATGPPGWSMIRDSALVPRRDIWREATPLSH